MAPTRTRKPDMPHAKCKHPWYPGVPYCLACWCQHEGRCPPPPQPEPPKWLYSGDGLGTWSRIDVDGRYEPDGEDEALDEAT
jgi:hypothetical protein